MCVAANCQNQIHMLAIFKKTHPLSSKRAGQHKLSCSSHRMVDVPNQANNVRGERHAWTRAVPRASCATNERAACLQILQVSSMLRSVMTRYGQLVSEHTARQDCSGGFISGRLTRNKNKILQHLVGPLARRGTSILDAKRGTCNLTGTVCVRSTDMIPRILGCCRG